MPNNYIAGLLSFILAFVFLIVFVSLPKFLATSNFSIIFVMMPIAFVILGIYLMVAKR